MNSKNAKTMDLRIENIFREELKKAKDAIVPLD